MFNRKNICCLFRDTDFGIPVTIFDNLAFKSDPKYCINEFSSTVFSTLNVTDYDKEQLYHFQITTIKDGTFTLHCSKRNFATEFKTLLYSKLPLSIRLDILENSDFSRIILLKEDMHIK